MRGISRGALTHAKALVTAVVQCLLVIAPFYFYQLWFQLRWCGRYRASISTLPDFSGNLDDEFESLGAPWCKGTPYLPKIYQSIQAAYWDVGLFKFYKASQLPNFLLATPIWVCTAFALSKAFGGLVPALAHKLRHGKYHFPSLSPLNCSSFWVENP